MLHSTLARWVVTAAILMVAALLIYVSRTTNEPESIPRFHQVTPKLYRGGQPSDRGYERLRQIGIKTVVNLRSEYDDRTKVEALGLQYVYFPLEATKPVSRETIQAFLDTVNNPTKQPVFVHCLRGVDRTGVMIAIYRVSAQGWSAERAYDEAREIGMRWWYLGPRRQLFEFAEQSRRASGGLSRR